MPSPQLADVCLVANLQTMGPTFLASANQNIFDHGAGMLLAARIVITSGMGNIGSSEGKINGPIPISEIDLADDYLVYFYPMKMQQLPKPDNEFSTGKGTYIICLIIGEDQKMEFRPLERTIERAILPYVDEFDFSHTISGEVPEDVREQFSGVLSEIYEEINLLVEFSTQFQGGSLFDVGLLATLPDKLSSTAKKLMLHPKGILESEIEDKVTLKTLFQVGLVDREEREDGTWIIPR